MRLLPYASKAGYSTVAATLESLSRPSLRCGVTTPAHIDQSFSFGDINGLVAGCVKLTDGQIAQYGSCCLDSVR